MYDLDSVVDYGLRRIISNDGICQHCVPVESMLFRALAASRLTTPVENSSEDHQVGEWDTSHGLYQQYAMCRVLMVWRITMFWYGCE